MLSIGGIRYCTAGTDSSTLAQRKTSRSQIVERSGKAKVAMQIHSLKSSAVSLVIVTFLMTFPEAIWQSPQRNK
jgi:hypothetical protein